MKFSKIMMVDDDAFFLEEIGYYLSLKGCKVISAAGGPGVVERALAELPDAIFIDLSSGPRGGVSIAERLKSLSVTAAIPVIFMTGYYSLLTEYPEIKICFKRISRPEAVAEEMSRMLDDF